MTKFNKLYFFAWIVLLASGAAAQQPTPSPSTTPQKESEIKKIETDIKDIFRIRPRHTTASNPADFYTPGVLQIEYGYGGYFRGNSFRSQQVGTLTVLYAATDQIGFELDVDTVSSQLDSHLIHTTGVGDSRFTVQLDIRNEAKHAPSFAVSYFAKLPFASVAKKLGTGRFDHIVSALFSKKVGKFVVDFNTGLLINGKQGENGFVTGGQFVFSMSRSVSKKLNLQAEIFGESKNAAQPQGLFANGVISYQLNDKFSLNAGLILGMMPSSPHAGATLGVSYTLPNFYKKVT